MNIHQTVNTIIYLFNIDNNHCVQFIASAAISIAPNVTNYDRIQHSLYYHIHFNLTTSWVSFYISLSYIYILLLIALLLVMYSNTLMISFIHCPLHSLEQSASMVHNPWKQVQDQDFSKKNIEQNRLGELLLVYCFPQLIFKEELLLGKSIKV